MSKSYLVNEIYFTIHGEGVRYGTPHVFVRFSHCNLTCGFCDTEFEATVEMTAAEIVAEAERLTAWQPAERRVAAGAKDHGPGTVREGPCRNVLFCGGEPLLQLDEELIETFKAGGWFTVVETNGSRPAPAGVDWITCSPKVAEHAIALEFCNELKYVRGYGQGIPRPRCRADHYLISPMFEGNEGDRQTIAWCVQLVKDNPQWRLTIQHHKAGFGGIR